MNGFEPDWTNSGSSGTVARSMAVHAYLIAFQQPMPAAPVRGQESVRVDSLGVTFNLIPAGG